ncbi:hypothetical protein MG296_05340 [Flavobacteriaceae bacterium TK19130]|nr:hypothetical protein [Thermobacterium salinum]
MKKYLIIALLVLALLVVGYLTFVVAIFEIVIGSIFLVICALALLGVWIMWKKKTN